MDTPSRALRYWRARRALIPVLILAVVASIVFGAGPAFGAPLGPIRVAMELDGKFAGWLQNGEGGMAQGDVVEEAAKAGSPIKKHVANFKWSEITVQMGTGMSGDFYQWLQDTMDGRFTRHNGAIVAVASDGKAEIRRMDWTNGEVSEIGMPALDAASKDAAKMTIKIKPEYTKVTRYGGAQFAGGPSSFRQKQWTPANFRLKIDGLDAVATRVNKIEALVIKQKIVQDPAGASVAKEPAAIEYPNLTVAVADINADGFWASTRTSSSTATTTTSTRRAAASSTSPPTTAPCCSPSPSTTSGSSSSPPTRWRRAPRGCGGSRRRCTARHGVPLQLLRLSVR